MAILQRTFWQESGLRHLALNCIVNSYVSPSHRTRDMKAKPEVDSRQVMARIGDGLPCTRTWERPQSWLRLLLLCCYCLDFPARLSRTESSRWIFVDSEKIRSMLFLVSLASWMCPETHPDPLLLYSREIGVMVRILDEGSGNYESKPGIATSSL